MKGYVKKYNKKAEMGKFQKPKPISKIIDWEGLSMQNKVGAINHEYKRMTKLLVKGLHPSSGDDALYNHFSQFGKVKQAVVIRNPMDNTSKGYGFVILTDPRSAAIAIDDPNPYIDGNRCNVNFASEGSTKRYKQRSNPMSVPHAQTTTLQNTDMLHESMSNVY